jgi:hypothetical protein
MGDKLDAVAAGILFALGYIAFVVGTGITLGLIAKVALWTFNFV